MPAGATVATGGLSSSQASNSDAPQADTSSSPHPYLPLSSNNHGHYSHSNTGNNGNHAQESVHFLTAPSADAGLRRSALRSATAAGNLHQLSTRRTLRNINAIRFLRSIKVDGAPSAFTEADEHSSTPIPASVSLNLPSVTCSFENENSLQLYQQQQSQPQKPTLQKKLSLQTEPGTSPTPTIPTRLDIDMDESNHQLSDGDRQMGAPGEDTTSRRTSSRNGAATPLDVQVSYPIGSFSSSESPTKQHADQGSSINVIPPTPTLPPHPGSETKRHYDMDREVDDDSLPFFASAEDISPNSTRSPRRPSGGVSAGADYSKYHHSHHHYYQPYHHNTHRSPPRTVPAGHHREVVRVSDQMPLRFKHMRDEEFRYEVGEQDIASKSFRLRHASQREMANAGGILSTFFQDDSVFGSGGKNNNDAREISFCDLLVVTANALCRSFTDGQQHPHIQQPHHQSLVVTSPSTLVGSSNKHHQHHHRQMGHLCYFVRSFSWPKFDALGEIEIRLYEYDPEKLDSPSFLQSVNRCPVAMPSYSVTVLGYYDPSSAKKLLNDQFRERFPDVQLTFTKMRSLKREMKKIALKCTLDLWCIAQSYVFFEKLILKLYIKKPNRKLCAGACLLLSAKLNDIRKSKIPSLIQEIESTFRIDREDLLICEFNVFLALDFTLMVPDCEVIPHLSRLIEQQHQSTGGVFGASASSAALHSGASPQSFALLQQHMQQHVHVRMPAVPAVPTSSTSALQTTNCGNGSNSNNGASIAAVVAPSVASASLSVIPYPVKSYNNVTNHN